MKVFSKIALICSVYFLIFSSSVCAQETNYPAPGNFYIEADDEIGCHLTGNADSVTLHWDSVEGDVSYRHNTFAPGEIEALWATPRDGTSVYSYVQELGVWRFNVRVFNSIEDVGKYSEECTYTKISETEEASVIVNGIEDAEGLIDSEKEDEGTELLGSFNKGLIEDLVGTNLIMIAVGFGLLLFLTGAVLIMVKVKKDKKKI